MLNSESCLNAVLSKAFDLAQHITSTAPEGHHIYFKFFQLPIRVLLAKMQIQAWLS